MEDNFFAGYGKTVYGVNFIGRDTEIKKIQQRLFSKEFGNLSIVGLPKIGKSSLAYHSLFFQKEKLWTENKFLVEWISLKSYKSSKELYHKLTLSIKDKISKLDSSNAALIEILEDNFQYIKNPKTSFVELEHYLLSFFSEIVSNNIRVLVILDEFDYVKEILGEVDYQMLRTLSYEPDHQIAFITTSRRSIFDIERYSGQGSNFFGTFVNIRLGGFTDSEARVLFTKANIKDNELIDKIRYYTGNHPYLVSMVLYKYFESSGEIDMVLDNVKSDILQYFDDVYKVLDKDNLAEKLIRIYSGIYEGVSKTEEEYIMNYGLFVKDERGNNKPFSEFFNMYLTLKWRESPFKLVWPEAEKCLKYIITECVNEIYGDDWEKLIEDDLPRFSIPEDFNFIDSLKKRRKKERYLFGAKASPNLIDQLYPRHYAPLVELHWDDFYQDVFDGKKVYWTDNLEFIAKRIRNPESHSRDGLLTDKEMQRASLICTEIIKSVNNWLS
jgi:AAA+ ATPase superfamily predicted ATPase